MHFDRWITAWPPPLDAFVSRSLIDINWPRPLLSPDLHAFAPGAHVLAQQQVVEGDGAHDVELLLDHLLDELRVGAVLAHGGVEGVELPQDGVQRVGALVGDAGRALAEAGGLHPRHALDGLVLQHARNCREGAREWVGGVYTHGTSTS